MNIFESKPSLIGACGTYLGYIIFIIENKTIDGKVIWKISIKLTAANLVFSVFTVVMIIANRTFRQALPAGGAFVRVGGLDASLWTQQTNLNKCDFVNK